MERRVWVDVSEQGRVFEECRADEVFSFERVFGKAEHVFVEGNEKTVVGEDIRGSIAVHSAHQRVSVEAGMVPWCARMSDPVWARG